MAHERGTADHPSLSFLKMAYSSVRIETEAFRAPNNRHPGLSTLYRQDQDAFCILTARISRGIFWDHRGP
jgi:hypothetical protein